MGNAGLKPLLQPLATIIPTKTSGVESESPARDTGSAVKPTAAAEAALPYQESPADSTIAPRPSMTVPSLSNVQELATNPGSEHSSDAQAAANARLMFDGGSIHASGDVEDVVGRAPTSRFPRLHEQLAKAMRSAGAAGVMLSAPAALASSDFGIKTVSADSSIFVKFVQLLSQGDPLTWAAIMASIPVGFLAAKLYKKWAFSRKEMTELHQELSSPSWRDRRLAIKTIMKRSQGIMIVDDLLRLAQSDLKTQVRVAAIGALGDMKQAAAVEPFIQILTNNNEKLALAAASALGDIGDPRAAQPLLQLALREREGDLFESAVLNLLSIGDPATLQELGRRVEKDILRGLRTEDWERATFAQRLLDAYEEFVDEDDDASRAIAKGIDAVASAVNQVNAKSLLDEALRIIGEGEDSHSHFNVGTFAIWSMIATPLMGFIMAQQSTEDSAEDILETAGENVLEVSKAAARKIVKMNAAQFQSLYGPAFKGHATLLSAAVKNPDRRIAILLSLGVTPEAMAR